MSHLADNEQRPKVKRIPRLEQRKRGIPSADADTVRYKINARINVLTYLIIAVFALLYLRTAYLQIFAAEGYQVRSASQAERVLSIPAPRGNIFDVNGKNIVTSRYAQVITVQPNEIPKEQRDRIVRELSEILQMDQQDIVDKIESKAFNSWDRRPIAIDVNPDIVFWLHTNGATRFPGVYADRIMMREYPEKNLAAHIVGYTGEISKAQLKDGKHTNYRSGDQIGLAGVESTWESALHGKDGSRRVSVNARGEVTSNVSITKQAVAGSNVYLTLDIAIQKAAEEALHKGILYARTVPDTETGTGRGGTYKATAGSVVVLDAKTGATVAMASSPTFNPEAFVGGISSKEWTALQSEENGLPLLNRAIQSAYPPGSVYKIVSAASALSNDFIAPDTYIACPAKWEWNKSVYRNWRDTSAGSLNVSESLEQSCDTFYYELAKRMFLRESNSPEGQAYVKFAKEKPSASTDIASVPLPEEFMATTSKHFGLGQKSGIDLPAEAKGTVPGREWRMNYWQKHKKSYCENAQTSEPGSYSKDLYTDLCNFGFRWRGGDSVNMSIGQGDVQMTPLQVADMFAAVANRGTIYTPHVVSKVQHADGTIQQVVPTVKFETGIAPSDLAAIEQGLIQVTTGSNGTAKRYFKKLPFQVAAKTGTAEHKPKQPYAWFGGYNVEEINGKRYVVVATIEEGGGGSSVAAPIVEDIFEAIAGVENKDAPPAAAPGEAVE